MGNIKELERRINDLMFSKGMFIEVLSNYNNVVENKRYFIFNKKIDTDKYECKKCNQVVPSGMRMAHYAEYHYEKEVTKWLVMKIWVGR